MQYLYQDGDFWHFMMPENFEQYTAGKAAVGDNAQWLKDGVVCIVTLWNNVPLVVTPPPHIELKIVETDPGRARRHRHRRPEAREARDRRRGARAALHQRRRNHPRRHAHGRVHLAREAVSRRFRPAANPGRSAASRSSAAAVGLVEARGLGLSRSSTPSSFAAPHQRDHDFRA